MVLEQLFLIFFPDGAEKIRSLTTTEQNYSQIEKEALSIIFTAKMFLKMIFGQQSTLIANHKPLLAYLGQRREFLFTRLTGHNDAQQKFLVMISGSGFVGSKNRHL